MNPWREKREIGNATLYLGDCLEILPTLEKVDAVITDPPYEQSNSGGGLVAKRATYQDIGVNLSSFDFGNYWGALKESTKTQHGYIWGAKSIIDEFVGAAKKAKLNWDLLVYAKDNPIPMKNNRYLSSFEFICFFRGVGSFWNNEAEIKHYSKIKRVTCKPSVFGHPTEKDVKTIESMLTVSTKEGHEILDPFMGSGTTGVACMNLGRRFIGVEIEKKYFDIAVERIDQAQRQQRLFA